MYATRYDTHNTSDNLKTILGLIKDERTKHVYLFASPTVSTPDFANGDGPETNLPLVAAMAIFVIPGVKPVSVVFDGLFLTAAREPRYSEVRDLLDAAVNSGKAFFSEVRTPFTSSLSPDSAAKVLAGLGPITPLTAASRPAYFSLISSLPEAQMVRP